MDIKQLEALILAVEGKSISAAARAMKRGQPQVSQWIAELEDSLNLELFTRTGNRVQPTENAYELVPFARTVLQQQRALQSVATRLARGERQYLAIALGEGIPASALTPALPALLTEHPGLNLDVLRLASDRILESVVSGDCQLALIEESAQRHPGLAHRAVAGFEEVLVARAGLFPHDTQPVSVDDLQAHRELAWAHSDSLDAEGISPVFAQSDDGSVIVDLLLAGQGYAVLPKPMVQPWLDRGELETVTTDFEVDPVYRRYELVWQRGDEDPCLLGLIDALSRHSKT